MKKGKVKKTKEVSEVPENELTIIELAKLEKNLPSKIRNNPNVGKEKTREVFKIWLALPDVFKGKPEQITSLLGITDGVTLELLQIKTMQQFADEFGTTGPMLSRWRKAIETKSDFLDEVKRQMKPLTKNIIASLYRKAIEEGDAQRFTAWMKIIEDWREQLGVEHSGSVTDGLTEEERTALEKLRIKNTYTKT